MSLLVVGVDAVLAASGSEGLRSIVMRARCLPQAAIMPDEYIDYESASALASRVRPPLRYTYRCACHIASCMALAASGIPFENAT